MASVVAVVNSKKRAAAVVEEVDLDEQERRRKRAERFGIPVVVRFSKLNCPMFHSCLCKFGAGCQGLISRISALTVFTDVLSPLCGYLHYCGRG